MQEMFRDIQAAVNRMKQCDATLMYLSQQIKKNEIVLSHMDKVKDDVPLYKAVGKCILIYLTHLQEERNTNNALDFKIGSLPLEKTILKPP